MKKSNGLVLSELIMAITLSSFILTLLVKSYWVYYESHTRQVAHVTLQQNAELAIQALKAAVQKAGYPDCNAAAIPRLMGWRNAFADALTIKGLAEKSFYIARASHQNEDGSPMYALIRRDNKSTIAIIEGIERMHIQYTLRQKGSLLEASLEEVSDWSQVVGVAFEMVLRAGKITKTWYAYAAMHCA